LEERGIDGYISLRKEGKTPHTPGRDRYPATGRMAEKLSTADGKARYSQRKHLVEAVNGWIKHILSFRQFSMRGLTAAKGEWDLVCLALNLKRMKPLMAFT